MSKFGEKELDQEIIKTLNLNETEVVSQNVPFKAFTSKEDSDYAFSVAERIFNERMRIKDLEREKEKQIPVWEQEAKPIQQVRKFY